MAKKRIKPASEAEYFVRQNADRAGFESMFIDEYIGMSACCIAANGL